MRVLIIFVLFTKFTFAQQILVLGNVDSFCFTDDSSYLQLDTLPSELDSFSSIMFFSGSTSTLNDTDIEAVLNYTNAGGGLYLGAENQPLQAESNQITSKLYNKVSYGNFDSNLAECAEDGNLDLEKDVEIPAGRSTVAFPLDYRLTVEAWVDDEPLILSGEIGRGKVIIDGGYSRFYCESSTEQTDRLLKQILIFLKPED